MQGVQSNLGLCFGEKKFNINIISCNLLLVGDITSCFFYSKCCTYEIKEIYIYIYIIILII